MLQQCWVMLSISTRPLSLQHCHIHKWPSVGDPCGSCTLVFMITTRFVTQFQAVQHLLIQVGLWGAQLCSGHFFMPHGYIHGRSGLQQVSLLHCQGIVLRKETLLLILVIINRLFTYTGLILILHYRTLRNCKEEVWQYGLLWNIYL